ncbi:sensor domain-containing diguanylate cyclase [Marinobacter sp. F4216]|uniref:sensor domain-containing diguanylate cyclase n=1 Tax=Marinobacter sp. F4216 TaxID=2874281 RepID=UPI001CBD8B82|nr:diguanylate cyclase [Marinobacter sp. F4216]MBZ2169415.1 GGDEF domain-containing protein [Marinobacter sp. F4216]
MSLQTRLLGLIAGLLFAASGASWLAYQQLSEHLVQRWGQQVAEVQVRYDSARLVQSLEREISLAQKMANAPVMIQWAHQPDDPALKAKALGQLKEFRSSVSDKSYFVALLANRHYYYNAGNDTDTPFKYLLDPDDADDSWFFTLVNEARDLSLDVNHDTELGVTKLWIDVLMKDENDQILGVMGTGVELATLLEDIGDVGQQGLTTLFVNYNGTIELYRERNYLNVAGLIGNTPNATIDGLFNDPEDKQQILGMLQMLKQKPGTEGEVESGLVTIDGRTQLASAAFLPSIGWFEVTLLDLETLLPRSYLWPLIGIFLASLLLSLLVLHIVIRSRILKPIVTLEGAVKKVREGSFELPRLDKPDNEIGRLADHFEKMTRSLEQSNRELERKVAARTDELSRLARIDPLTGLKNRRGLDEVMEEEIERAKRQGTGFGVLWLDIDHFKTINDQHGHQVGDEILCRVSLWLKVGVRPYDHPGRWGGDEFVVVLSPCDEQTLEQIAARIRLLVEQESRKTGLAVTVSVGGYLCQPDDNCDAILRRADRALYQAKEKGRNTVCISGMDGENEAIVD